MSQQQLSLGGFGFEVGTAAYQSLQRTRAWRWPAQERHGQAPALQYTGPEAEAVTLAGVIYPTHRGGPALEALRARADRGQPLVLVDGRGQDWGAWVVETLTENHSVFFADGSPRKVEFSLSLRRYGATP